MTALELSCTDAGTGYDDACVSVEAIEVIPRGGLQQVDCGGAARGQVAREECRGDEAESAGRAADIAVGAVFPLLWPKERAFARDENGAGRLDAELF